MSTPGPEGAGHPSVILPCPLMDSGGCPGLCLPSSTPRTGPFRPLSLSAFTIGFSVCVAGFHSSPLCDSKKLERTWSLHCPCFRAGPPLSLFPGCRRLQSAASSEVTPPVPWPGGFSPRTPLSWLSSCLWGAEGEAWAAPRLAVCWAQCHPKLRALPTTLGSTILTSQTEKLRLSQESHSTPHPNIIPHSQKGSELGFELISPGLGGHHVWLQNQPVTMEPHSLWVEGPHDRLDWSLCSSSSSSSFAPSPLPQPLGALTLSLVPKLS